MKLLNERNWRLPLPAKTQFSQAVRVSQFDVDNVLFHIQIQMKLSDIGTDLKYIQWGASSRWSFHPNSAKGRIKTMTTGKTHNTLDNSICFMIWLGLARTFPHFFYQDGFIPFFTSKRILGQNEQISN